MEKFIIQKETSTEIRGGWVIEVSSMPSLNYDPDALVDDYYVFKYKADAKRALIRDLKKEAEILKDCAKYVSKHF